MGVDPAAFCARATWAGMNIAADIAAAALRAMKAFRFICLLLAVTRWGDRWARRNSDVNVNEDPASPALWKRRIQVIAKRFFACLSKFREIKRTAFSFDRAQIYAH